MVAARAHSGRAVEVRTETCEHLAPLELALRAAGVPLGYGRPCPHDTEWGTWYATTARFHARILRRRLHLNPCVTYEEYEGYLGASDATFYCTCCKQAIVGLHPRTAPPGTPDIA